MIDAQGFKWDSQEPREISSQLSGSLGGALGFILFAFIMYVVCGYTLVKDSGNTVSFYIKYLIYHLIACDLGQTPFNSLVSAAPPVNFKIKKLSSYGYCGN